MTVEPKRAKGLVYVFTGDGKGKTSAALGVAVRMLLLGKKVLWVAWYKDKRWLISERKLVKHFKNLKMFWMGSGFYLGGDKIKLVGDRGRAYDTDTLGGHKNAAESALNLVREALVNGLPHWGIPELVVMDEVVKSVADGLLDLEELGKVVDLRAKTHLVLTGRDGKGRLLKIADLVSNVKKVKHPFDKGELAVRGLDY
jgi:cob(I)alamin adenosyltransferase